MSCELVQIYRLVLAGGTTLLHTSAEDVLGGLMTTIYQL